MSNIHDYSKIETIITEHYIIEKKIIKNIFSKKEYFIENLVDKQTETYQAGILVHFEEFLYNQPHLHKFGNRISEENGYRWEIEYNWENGDRKETYVVHYDNNGHQIKSYYKHYSSYSTIPDSSISTFKYHFNEQGKLIQVSEYDISNTLESVEKRKYNHIGKCTKLIEEFYENQKIQKIITTLFEYENNYVSKETETIHILLSQAGIRENDHKTITIYNRNSYGDTVYKKTHYVDRREIVERYYQLQYDAYGNCTEYRCKVYENGTFKRESLWKYKIRYKS